jgi:hypothetical protein
MGISQSFNLLSLLSPCLRGSVVCIFILIAGQADAQLSRLDKTTLIEGLRQEGMRDLLRYFARSELGNDPVLQKQVILNQHLLDFEQSLESSNIDQAAESFDQAIATSEKLISEHAGHEQRPIWQTQLAEQLLFESLGTLHRNAGLFYEFGVPTAEQLAVYERIAPQSLALLEDADVRFFKLQSDLPKEPDHTEKRIDTGLWDRMINQFYNVRTQFLLANALYDTWQLPDSHSYFQNLGNNPRIVRQQKTIKKERARLLALASERLESLLVGGKAEQWNIALACECLLGRVLAAQEMGDQALDRLQKVMDAKQSDLLDLTARLAHAHELGRQDRAGQAISDLNALASHPMASGGGGASGNLLLRVLVIDAKHRVMREAAQNPQQIAASYRPYLDLLADGSLGKARDGMRDFIHQRWVSSVPPNSDLSQLPSVVVAAMGRILRVEGQNLTIESKQPKLAKEKLQRAVQVNSDLLKREHLDNAVRAQAMYNQAVSIYFLGRDDVSEILRATKIMVDLAQRFPDQPIGEEAISSAVSGVLHPLHAKAQQIAGVDEAYRRGAEVLLDKYADSIAADDERFYYASTVLVPARQFDKATTTLAKVPFGHQSYFEAQRELLYCCLTQVRDGGGNKNKLELDAQRVQTESAGSSGDDAQSALNAGGHAVLILAELATIDNDYTRAIKLLDGFEGRFGSDKELIREALGKRIAWLAQADRFDDASSEAGKMMESFPDDAAVVIDAVLLDLDNQIEQLRKKVAAEKIDRRRAKLEDRIVSIAATAGTLAQLLLDWANTQKFSEQDMVPYELLRAKSARLAGQNDESLKQLRVLMEKYGEDADVIFETAETLHATEDRASLVEAGSLYSMLIEGLPAGEDGSYPARYFVAWMRYFQICEKLDENTGNITLTVRQLELTSPNLGGEPYRTELIRLRNRYKKR